MSHPKISRNKYDVILSEAKDLLLFLLVILSEAKDLLLFLLVILSEVAADKRQRSRRTCGWDARIMVMLIRGTTIRTVPTENMPMPLRYASGEKIMKGDKVLHVGQQGVIELVADPPISDPETHWFVQEYGRGVMISEHEHLGRVFMDDPEDDGELKFLSRSEKGL